MFDDFKLMTSEDSVLKSEIREKEDQKEYYITGIMSGPVLDYQSDIMTKSGLESMVNAINNGIFTPDNQLRYVPLRSGHGKEWEYELGWFTKAWLDDDLNMWIEAELDPLSSKAMELYNRLQRTADPMKPQRLGFSIGGVVTKARKVFDSTVRKTVRYIEEIRLNEGSITSQPVYYPSYAEVIMKSINWEEVPMEDNMKTETTLETHVESKESEPVVKSAEETPVEVTESKEEETAKSEEAVEEVVAEVAEEPEVVKAVETVPPVEASVDSPLGYEAITKALQDNDESYQTSFETITKSLDSVVSTVNALAEAYKKMETIEKGLAEVLTTVTEISLAEVDKSLVSSTPEVRTVNEFLNAQPPERRLEAAVEVSMAARRQHGTL